jgi:hypothetical protein
MCVARDTQRASTPRRRQSDFAKQAELTNNKNSARTAFVWKTYKHQIIRSF